MRYKSRKSRNGHAIITQIRQKLIAHAYLNQPNEIKELSVEMMEFLHIAAYPTILLRIGYAETLPYSKRKEINEVIIDE